MAQPDETWFRATTEALIDPDNQRVWSVIVSLFGDLARQPGDRLSGTALLRIISPMGIRHEAIRVALHRLRKDGWLESERIGRASVHSLTAFGRSRSDEVVPRIYARDPAPSQDWHILVAGDTGDPQGLDDLLMTESHIGLARNVALGIGPPPRDCDDLLVVSVSPDNVPGWVQRGVCPDDLRLACRDLSGVLSRIGPPPKSAGLTALQSATLRTLLVHRWRRIALRYADLPAGFFPADWTGPECRRQVFALLDLLPRPSVSGIEEDAAT